MSPREISIDDVQDWFAERAITSCVILASTFRSGSSYVASLLSKNGLPGLRKELFNKLAAAEDRREYLQATLDPFRSRQFRAKLMWSDRNALANALGIARRDSQLFKSVFPNAKWLFVYREDPFSQAISLWRAKSTGSWDSNHQGGPTPDYDFGGINQQLRYLLSHTKLWQDFFSLSGIVPHAINYEQFEAAPAEGLKAALQACGLDRENPVIASNLKPQRDQITVEYRERFMDELYRGRV